ncbi:HtaA domain-containing protein [Actinacidiphila sp. ITFR-21]|uniref:HtaA domain-containing protein n=1 Tax=Actinacidiphila sp. ITFR-21 TaxID=3075199 RepID=UPI00288A7A0D|nr:HtaA domain-containing protein [Streptomyces sp. ITFR-21]WNI15279.1 HtaA domain-containing protein [Streptomyces sp. ITFR-21]
MDTRFGSRALAAAVAVAATGGAVALGLPALAAAADAPSSIPLTGGTFDWGVKQSFRSYVTGPAAGTITAAAGASTNADGTFRFSGGEGTYDTSTHAVSVAFAGSVEFASTLHGFDIKLADLKVSTSGTAGTLTADVTSAGSTADDVPFAALDLSAVRPGSGAGGAMTFDGIPLTLTAQGAQAFNGMYQAGTVLDPADLAVTPGAAPTTPPTTVPPTTTGPTTGTPTSTPPTDPTASPTSTPTGEPATTAPTGEPTTPASGGPAAVVDGNLDWGVKESFRSYVTGPVAAGKVELTGGAVGNAAGYRFPKGTGTWDADGKVLNASFSGAVRFLGHLQQGAYALDLKLSDLRVSTKGAGGTLTADVSSKDLGSGKATEYDDIAVAELTGVAPKAAGKVVTVSAAKAVLTADGAKVFSGFYKAGDALDPVTVAVSLASDAGLPSAPATTPAGSATGGGAGSGGSAGAGTVGGTGDSGGDGAALASTGSDTPVTPLLAAAGALVLTGAAATITATRRRRTNP